MHDTQQVLNKALVVITIIVVLQKIGDQFNSEQWKKQRKKSRIDTICKEK